MTKEIVIDEEAEIKKELDKHKDVTWVSALDHSGTCKKCGEEGHISRHPNRFPFCYRCGTIQLWLPKTPDAPCVTPNGRTDGHGSYVTYKKGVARCSFCNKKV